MSLDDKIRAAQEILQQNLTQKTVLFCSFGKDSMVCLDLLRRMDRHLPVVFNRNAFFPEKEIFANRVIVEMQLRVHSYPPLAVVLSLRHHPDIINIYRLPHRKTLLMPVGINDPVEGKPFACGLELLTTLRGTVRFPWDSIILGQKASDKDVLFDDGDMTPVAPTFEPAPGLKLIFPIVDFTDADVWEYTERFSVPYNDKRYDKANGYREFKDFTFNSDQYYACVKCVLPGQPDLVECPKGGLVPNRHEGAPIVEIKPMPYMRGFRV
jgi:3'-phosphoadenosine 5'-phosphosulfate sulfotransferase (PAPS reductase)/FAD synthetase